VSRLPGKRDLMAAWWSASLRALPPVGLIARWSAPLAFAGGGLVISGCAEWMDETEAASMQEALEAQREQGWNVGQEGQPLLFPDAVATDVAGTTGWRAAMGALALRLTPADVRWVPYYDPTLFQALQAPHSADLQIMMRPVFSPAMGVAAARGQALLSLFLENGSCRTDVALVIDIPGPEAVALAAALAPCFDPVFLLDNWPHPAGVVPSHLTLGAALYYLPWFERERANRAPTAPPVFVVDRQRLTPYTDDGSKFDNRYLAGLPPREALVAAGIRRLLYIAPDDSSRLDADDLNDDLVSIDGGGIEVKVLALSDFSETPLPGWSDVPPPPPELVWGGPSPPLPSLRFYFGGSPGSHRCFWSWYGWSGRPAAAPPVPPPLISRAHYRPAPRPTFASGFHGTPPASRSGSLGRAHFGGMSG
jgi:hypothetical protein